jgi:formylglycine-generating enzyme required for sulfatase activity
VPLGLIGAPPHAGPPPPPPPVSLHGPVSPGLVRVPDLGDLVELPAGRYRLGPPDAERIVELGRVLIGRYPLVNEHLRAYFAEAGRPAEPGLAARLEAPPLADHPATGLRLEEAEAVCAWAGRRLGRPARLPSGDEWEAAARGADARAWPWGDAFDPDRCACAEVGWGGTAPVTAHPAGAGPSGAEQLAGNVWEWVADRDTDGWTAVRGGSYLDHAAGLRAWRALPADPQRATPTTGLRIAIDPQPDHRREDA